MRALLSGRIELTVYKAIHPKTSISFSQHQRFCEPSNSLGRLPFRAYSTRVCGHSACPLSVRSICPSAASTARNSRSITNYQRPFYIPHSSLIPALKTANSSSVSTHRSIVCEQRRACSHRARMCRYGSQAEVVSSGMDISKGREVLPVNVRPVHYDLTLEPDMEKFTYGGKVKIE